MSKDTIVALHAEHQGRWKNREEIAERMIALIGQLYREKNIVVSVYGRSLINRSVIQILKSHRRTRMLDVELSVVHTFPILEALMKIENIGSAEVDIGKLAVEYKNQGGDVDAFVAKAVESIEGKAKTEQPKDVVLYGFGRIGRILARLIISQSGLGRGLSLKAIVVRKSSDGDFAKRASLLRRDSIHGTFDGTISVDEENEAIIANGQFIKVIYASSPSEVDYTAYGIENALLIDNTGKWRDAEGLSQHLKCAGIARVVLTAPSKGEMKNVVFGVNNSDILDEDKIISAASCTTNAITPVLKVLDDKYKVLNGHVETVHSFTNDQNLIDNYHKADRRGRRWRPRLVAVGMDVAVVGRRGDVRPGVALDVDHPTGRREQMQVVDRGDPGQRGGSASPAASGACDRAAAASSSGSTLSRRWRPRGDSARR